MNPKLFDLLHRKDKETRKKNWKNEENNSISLMKCWILFDFFFNFFLSKRYMPTFNTTFNRVGKFESLLFVFAFGGEDHKVRNFDIKKDFQRILIKLFLYIF